MKGHHSSIGLRLARLGLVLGGLLCAWPFAASAQSAKPIRFETLSLGDGLSQSTVLSIHQDSSGFVWLGTEDGLNRFDGYHFEQYKQNRGDAHSLPNDYVSALAEDHAGHMWIGTDGGGLVRWDRESGQFSVLRAGAEEGGLSGNAVRALAMASGDTLWAGTLRNGLNQIDAQSGRVLRHFRHEPDSLQSLSSDEVYAVYVDRRGRVWVGTNGGLNWLDPATGQIVRYTHDPENPSSISDDRVRAIVEDSRGRFWVGTRRGLNRLDPQSGEFVRYTHRADDPASLSHDRVRTIFEDDQQRLWVGTASGLNLYDEMRDRFSVYSADPADRFSLPDNHIITIRQDAGGILWVGTNSGGVAKWNPRAWSMGHYRTDALGGADSTLNVTSFAEGPDGAVWVGSFGGGLGRLAGTNSPGVGVSDYQPLDGIAVSDSRIMALLFDRRGALWAGTLAGGLNRIDLDTGEATVYRADAEDPNSLSANGIMSLFEDRRGRIWAGTFGGGVSRFDPEVGGFEVFGHNPDDPNSLSSPRATAIAEARDGTMWVGTDGGGLNYFDSETERWHHLRHDPDDIGSLSADTVYSLHVDRRGTLWVGTRAGLNRLVGQPGGDTPLRFANISSADGLANDVIYGIRPDANDNLWLSTNHGLSRFNPQTGEITNYHREHGLQKEEFNFGAHFRTARGWLVFGGSNGFNLFDPDALNVNSNPPPLVLTSVAVHNEPVTLDEPLERFHELSLNYGDDVLTFEFAALDFAAPSRNRYAYMLEGFDNDWVEAGVRRRVTYTNLDAGNYRFLVRASNSDGVWNNQGLEVSIRVAPAPWESWWAYLCYALAVMLVVYLIARAQQQKLEREAQYRMRLEREVEERTEDLQLANNKLVDANEALQEASFTDPLTGLRNRRYLFDEVIRDIALVRRERAASPGADLQQFVFLMIDLDNFKPINDTYGHAAGDQLLLDISRALTGACRSSDFIIRWGGDEFLVAARRTTAEEAEALAGRIRATIGQLTTMLEGGVVARTTCSIGYASYPFAADGVSLLSWEQVLGVADRAMYAAKELRDAYVGFEARSPQMANERLYNAIQEDPIALLTSGVIGQRSSHESPADAPGGAVSHG